MAGTQWWVVRCDDFTSRTGYRSEADALRAVERIEALGACQLPHVIEVLSDGEGPK